jgi:hypothetical protein
VSHTKCIVGRRCSISHVGSALGRDLVLRDEMMLQQVFLSYSQKDVESVVEDSTLSVAVLLSIRDDIKAQYESSQATICGHSWHELFEVKRPIADVESCDL